MEVHYIGDSHTWQFLGKLPQVFDNNTNLKKYKKDNSLNYSYKGNLIKIYSYRCCSDGALAYTIKKREKMIKKILSNIPENCIIVFMFGEVDCRWKLLQYAFKKYNNSQEIRYNFAHSNTYPLSPNNCKFEKICIKGVDDILNNYIPYIKNFQNIVNDKTKICLWGPHPTFMEATYYHAMTGNGQTRNKVTYNFNKKLKIICKENNWLYCSLFDELIGDNFITKNFGKQYTWCGYDVRKYPHRNKALIPEKDLIYVTNSSDIWQDSMHINPNFARDRLLSQIFNII